MISHEKREKRKERKEKQKLRKTNTIHIPHFPNTSNSALGILLPPNYADHENKQHPNAMLPFPSYDYTFPLISLYNPTHTPSMFPCHPPIPSSIHLPFM